MLDLQTQTLDLVKKIWETVEPSLPVGFTVAVEAGGPVGDGKPGSWGGHCIPVMLSRPGEKDCVTWGDGLKMTNKPGH